MNFVLKTASLCWILVSVCESHMLEVQPGETVTLLCQNFSTQPDHIIWFRLVGRSNISRISFMISADGPASLSEGFQNGTCEMTSNTSTVFLQLKRVDQSNSGLYFCGFYSNNHSVIVSATYLKVKATDGITTLMKVILSSVAVLLVIVIFGLLVKIRKLQIADMGVKTPSQFNLRKLKHSSERATVTMTNIALKTASLCWILVSVCESHMLEVQPGETVTLLCQNFSTQPDHIIWFRLVDRSNISRISYMISSDGPASLSEGFQNGTCEMTSNTSTVFLQLKRVDQSNSGLYFCGFYSNNHSVIVSATYLKVKATDGITTLMKVILSSVAVLVMAVIAGLLVKIRTLQTVQNEDERAPRNEDDELKDAALSHCPEMIRSRRAASEREVETRVIYAATRSTTAQRELMLLS